MESDLSRKLKERHEVWLKAQYARGRWKQVQTLYEGKREELRRKYGVYKPEGKSGTDEFNGATGRGSYLGIRGRISKPCSEIWAHPDLYTEDHARGTEFPIRREQYKG
jgi:hypothetical protein